ncbi:MAG: hypothetical protein AAF318_16585 [Pseudomonadota bacterium]
MPLSGSSRRVAADETALCAFSFRELITHKRLAERAVRRGRNVAAAQALIGRIEDELEARRCAKFARHPAPGF